MAKRCCCTSRRSISLHFRAEDDSGGQI